VQVTSQDTTGPGEMTVDARRSAFASGRAHRRFSRPIDAEYIGKLERMGEQGAILVDAYMAGFSGEHPWCPRHILTAAGSLYT